MRGGANRWPEEIAQFIIDNYLGRPNLDLTEMVNKRFDMSFTVIQIKQWKKNHKLPSGLTGFFPKGHMPVNPIQKGQRLGPETEFKKGHSPLNKVPVGTERFRKGEYYFVKVAEPNVWKAKHRLVWEQHNGPIPDKHRVVFLNGDKTNADISNLALMSYGQTAIMSKRNLFFRDPELTKLGSKIAEIELKTNERKRKISNVRKY